jgi:hypothetical protein
MTLRTNSTRESASRSLGSKPAHGNPTDSLSKQNGVLAEVAARKADHEYQTAHLTETDAEDLAAVIVRVCSDKQRSKLAGQILE